MPVGERPDRARAASAAALTARPSRARRTVPAPAIASEPGGETAVKSADRVLTVLDLLAARGPSTFSEIVAALGLPNSSAHNLLQTMARRGYLELDPASRTWRLGLRLWEVAQAYGGNRDVVALGRPLMETLVAITGETVQMARLDGTENVYLAIAESPHPMKLVSTVGARLAAHATGLGKVLLAGLAPDEAEARLAEVQLAAFTPHTIIDRRRLLAELARIRAAGYATDDEEYVIGCRCVAVPVRDATGAVTVALSVSIPTPRWTPEIAERARLALLDAAAQLGRQLGAAVPEVDA